ncbi:MAG: energy transducer TonB [bacterium]
MTGRVSRGAKRGLSLAGSILISIAIHLAIFGATAIYIHLTTKDVDEYYIVDFISYPREQSVRPEETKVLANLNRRGRDGAVKPGIPIPPPKPTPRPAERVISALPPTTEEKADAYHELEVEPAMVSEETIDVEGDELAISKAEVQPSYAPQPPGDEDPHPTKSEEERPETMASETLSESGPRKPTASIAREPDASAEVNPQSTVEGERLSDAMARVEKPDFLGIKPNLNDNVSFLNRPLVFGEGLDFSSEDSDLARYHAILYKKVKEMWDPPREFYGYFNFYPSPTVISFEIERDGRVTNIKILMSSGYPQLDISAKRALEWASPLPPRPLGYPRSRVASFEIIIVRARYPRGG